MTEIATKPILAQTLRTWRVEPGMIYAVGVDAEGKTWVVESCPVGTHYWTVSQAMQLPFGSRTRTALREAIALAKEREQLDTLPGLPNLGFSETLPLQRETLLPAKARKQTAKFRTSTNRKETVLSR